MSCAVIALAAVGLLADAPPDPTPLPPGAVLRLGDARFRAGGPVLRLRFSADGSRLVAWAAIPNDRTRQRKTTWDASTGRRLDTAVVALPDEADADWPTAVMKGGQRVITVGFDRVPLVRDVADGRVLARLVGHPGVQAVAVSEDGSRLATADAAGLIRVWDGQTFRPAVEPRGHLGPVVGFDISHDGRRAVTIGTDETARVWDLTTGKELRAFTGVIGSRATFTPDGHAVRFVTGQEQSAVIRDVVTGLEVVTADHRTPPDRTVSACGRTRAEPTETGAVRLVEVASGEVRRTLPGHAGGVTHAGFTPDGRLLTAGGHDHGMVVWAVRVQDVPLPDSLKRETSAAKLWATMTNGSAGEAYLAMARLAADPGAAVKMARLRLKPGAELTEVAAVRAVELLEAIGTADAKTFLKELAEDDASPVRSREATAALKRLDGAQAVTRR